MPIKFKRGADAKPTPPSTRGLPSWLRRSAPPMLCDEVSPFRDKATSTDGPFEARYSFQPWNKHWDVVALLQTEGLCSDPSDAEECIKVIAYHRAYKKAATQALQEQRAFIARERVKATAHVERVKDRYRWQRYFDHFLQQERRKHKERERAAAAGETPPIDENDL